MLHIFVNHGEVIQVLDDSEQPQEKLLKEGTDYTVEYVPEEKPRDWLPKEGISIPASKKAKKQKK